MRFVIIDTELLLSLGNGPHSCTQRARIDDAFSFLVQGLSGMCVGEKRKVRVFTMSYLSAWFRRCATKHDFHTLSVHVNIDVHDKNILNTQLIIPSGKGYGAGGSGAKIPGGSTLVSDVLFVVSPLLCNRVVKVEEDILPPVFAECVRCHVWQYNARCLIPSHHRHLVRRCSRWN